MKRAIPDSIRRGRRDLDEIQGVRILEDLRWWDEHSRWSLRIRISRDGPESRFVPRDTEWYVLVEECYPRGSIKLRPAAAKGIACTFPHQSFNQMYRDERPWRSGHICLSSSVRGLGRSGLEFEPRDAAGSFGRLKWHVHRAMEWLILAASDRLLTTGQPFELPNFPVLEPGNSHIVFQESDSSFETWSEAPAMSGYVNLVSLAKDKDSLAVTGYFSADEAPIRLLEWGAGLLSPAVAEIGLWLLADGPLVLPPWQAPITWGQLNDAFALQDLTLFDSLRRLLPAIRDGKRHFLLLGYPFPKFVGGPNVRVDWQALRLPALTQKVSKKAGFRANREAAKYHNDRSTKLSSSNELGWVSTGNWDASELTTRGRLPDMLVDQRILLLGAGALGSAVAEMLVRAGVRRITIVDPQTLEAGNLCRHTLTTADIGKNKAIALADHLNKSGPHVEARGLPIGFPPDSGTSEQFSDNGLIIDCTAEDDVVQGMGDFAWPGHRVFASLSIGIKARRMLCFTASGRRFPSGEFFETVSPWLLEEGREADEASLPREGAGCWHPIFPASAIDIWLMTAAAVKQLERALSGAPSGGELMVLEQGFDESGCLKVGRAVHGRSGERQTLPICG